jgi:hypothetical protein
MKRTVFQLLNLWRWSAWSVILLCACLLQTSCQSVHVSPQYQLNGDLEHNYEQQANAENEFDATYAASTHNDQGDFYPVTWLVNAQRAAGPFWEHVEQHEKDKGVKATMTLLNQLVQTHGYNLLMATHDAQRVLGEETFAAFLRNAASSPQTKVFHYIYFGPGHALVQTGSTFVPALP